MESPVTFRRAKPEEAPEVRELIVRSMGHWGRSADYLAQAAALMELDGDDLARDEAWIAMADGVVAGFYRLSDAGDRLEIEEFHLDPPMIGRGIGRLMFRHATERARAAGGGWLVWSTGAESLGFYQHMGGEVSGTEPSGIEGDEPLMLMRLHLR